MGTGAGRAKKVKEEALTRGTQPGPTGRVWLLATLVNTAAERNLLEQKKEA